MSRNDTHRPSLLDPAEYEFLACFYQGSSKAMMRSYESDHRDYDQAMQQYSEKCFDGNFARKATCDHCGAAFAHGVLFLHKPTQTMIHVGHICAANTVGLPSRAAAVRKQAEKAAAEEKAREQRLAATAEWRERNADVVEFLAREHTHDFLVSLTESLHKWGSLSDRQAAAARKFIASEKERAARPAEEKQEPGAPVAERRREIAGTVRSSKWQDSDFGGSLKMLVEEDDGNRLWGTVPESIYRATAERHDENGMLMGSTLVGSRVAFTATVERSQKDEHFGFYKRPTRARVTRYGVS